LNQLLQLLGLLLMVLENHCFLQQQEMPHTSAVLQDACDVYVNGSWNHWQMCGDRMCMCKVAALYEDCGDSEKYKNYI